MAMFKRGSAVEVSSDDQGLRGSWYTATVVDPSGPLLLVEYHNLSTDDSGTSNLQEHVDPILVRPVPPIDPSPVFRLMDDVDAFHHDGWWEGVVTAVHPDSYSVFFRCSREQIDFPASDLRLHREWLGDDLWRPPFNPPLPPPPPASAPSSSSPRQKRKSRGDGDIAGGRAPKLRKTAQFGAVGIRNNIKPAAAAAATHAHGATRRTTIAALLSNNYSLPSRNRTFPTTPPSLSGRRASRN
ncbi:hypothetical protein RND81_07G007700 [Saponaria officinalis]|uniref:Agenet domain-containing protein n=1 Tax=Saponaria officinalis TaxID=3572 RepID=A0AAW1JMC2_SAPOF